MQSLPDKVSFQSRPAAHPCPACGGAGAEVIYELRGIPVHSCVLLDDPDSAKSFPQGDLALAVCSACGFAFNEAFDPARLDYSEDYEETQGCSPTFNAWQREFTGALLGRTGPLRQVVEVGCGRGDWLKLLCELSGAQGLGIDPSSTAGRALQNQEFQRARFEDVPDVDADLLACRHTLEHLPAVSEVLEGFRRLLGEGHLFLEVPDTRRIFDEGAFWDIYYEHCSYFTTGSLARLAERAGFHLRHVETQYGGQYVQLLAHTGAGSFEAADDLSATVAAAQSFARSCSDRLSGWHELLQSGDSIALWGSGSKATGFLTTLGAGDEVGAVVDINPAKHGRFVAGSGHPIVAPEALVDLNPAHVIIMNPVYEAEITGDLERLGVQARVWTC